jgi:amidohydrolase
MAAGAFITAVSTVVGRSVPSADNAVISIGHIQGGQFRSPNIIPSSVLVRGTARSFRAEIRQVLEDRLREIASSAAAMHGCSADYRFIRRYPPLVNHPEQTAVAVAAARRVVGAANVNGETGPLNGSEDFAFMLGKVPGAYMFIGNGLTSPPLHTPQYDFNDDAIAYGVAYWVSLVHRELGGEG